MSRHERNREVGTGMSRERETDAVRAGRAAAQNRLCMVLALVVLSLGTLHCADGQGGGSEPPEGGLAAILRHPDPLQRVRWTAEFLEAADPDDLSEIRYAFETAPLARGDREYALFGHWWATFDPDAAWRSTFESLRMEGGHVIRQIFRTWTRSDPSVMADYTKLWDPGTWGSTTPGMRPELVESVVVGWTESGEPGLEAWISGLKDAAAQAAGFKQYVTMKVMYEGGDETLRWAAALDESEGRRALLSTALNVVAHEDPQLAVEWLDRVEQMDADTEGPIRSIANSWGHHDPEAAAKWLLGREKTKNQSRGLRSVASHWVRFDYDAFAAWLRDRGTDTALDQMRTTFLKRGSLVRKFRVDFPVLLEVANEIADKSSRKREIFWVLTRWYRVDEAAVNAWFEANPGEYSAVLKNRLGVVPDKEAELIDAAAAERATKLAADGSS